MPSDRRFTADSLGVEALDALIGIGAGATVMNSLILLDENGTKGRYCKPIQRCFLAEAVENNQNMLLAGPLPGTMVKLLQNLPAKNDSKNTDERKDEFIGNNGEDFKIAWRYKTVQPLNSSITANGNASSTNTETNKYDLSRTDPNFNLENSREIITIFNEDGLKPPSLSHLWSTLREQITRPEFAASQKNGKILRILLNDLSSPFWSELDLLQLFLAQLKSFVRHSNAIVLITLDSQLLKPSLYHSCLQYVDMAFQLQRMDEQEQAKLHLRHRIDGGRFFVHKLPAIASAAPAHIPHAIDLLFSLRRSFFELKLLHLPPAIGDDGNEKVANKMACQSFVDQF